MWLKTIFILTLEGNFHAFVKDRSENFKLIYTSPKSQTFFPFSGKGDFYTQEELKFEWPSRALRCRKNFLDSNMKWHYLKLIVYYLDCTENKTKNNYNHLQLDLNWAKHVWYKIVLKVINHVFGCSFLNTSRKSGKARSKVEVSWI